MKVHNLKTIQPYFDDVRYGRKKFELRKDDRSFEVGDILNLWKYDPNEESQSGEVCNVKVTYVMRNFDGLMYGYCILGIKLIEIPF